MPFHHHHRKHLSFFEEKKEKLESSLIGERNEINLRKMNTKKTGSSAHNKNIYHIYGEVTRLC